MVFKKRDGASGGEAGVARLYFAGHELREGRDGRLIASHIGHAWVLGGEEYLRLDCEGRVKVLFADAQGAPRAEHGPYDHFSSVNGIIFADHLVLAHLDTKSDRWYVVGDGSEWPALLVEPA